MKSDVQLIDETRAGDSLAYGELVRRHQDRLYHTLLHAAGHAEEAEDVAQEAFVQAFLKLKSFQGKSAFYTWLYRIAFNILISRQRKHRREICIDPSDAAHSKNLVDENETPENRVQRLEREGQIHEALSHLSEEHRSILVLREMEGCCYETIAEILELPVGTVRSRLHRARLQLRDRLRIVLQEQ